MKASIVIFSLVLMGLSGTDLKANEIDSLRHAQFKEEDNADLLQHEDRLDSLFLRWYTETSSPEYPDSLALDTLPHCAVTVPDSVYLQRLKQLSEVSAMEMPFNSKVKAHINLYVNRKRVLSETILGLEEYYFPLFEEVLDREGLPMELKYMPVIESALNPKAFSRAGASGLWQFMYYTGKQYGLKVNSFVDERRDPRKSTEGAVNYLKDLYAIYGDWYLVIAAYNCGPGNVNKAIRRSHGAKDYWAIYYHLPRETRGYVPAFIAVNYMMNYHEEHNLYPRKPDLPHLVDTLQIKENVHLSQVSEVLKIPLELVRLLNPQYRKDIIPGGTKVYDLRLPIEFVADYIDLKDSIVLYKKDQYLLAKRESVSPNSKSGYAPVSPNGRAKLVYKVKSGDNLGFISDWYDVRLSDLRYWNNIYRNMIRVGQKLVIYVPKNKQSVYQDINQMTFAEKQKSNGKVQSKRVTATKSVSMDGNYEYYRVKSGDNLWTIARYYPGISSDDIKRLNNMSQSSNISPGQLLKIKRKS